MGAAYFAEVNGLRSSGESVALSNQLKSEMSARVKTEMEFREYKRQMSQEMREKEQWGEMLREAGLLA